MTDREVLLMAYGMLFALNAEEHMIRDIRTHLFGEEPSEPAPTFSESATSYRAPTEGEGTYYSAVSVFTTAPEAIARKARETEAREQMIERIDAELKSQTPSTPGEYRLKRSWFGEIGARIDECTVKSLKTQVGRYYAEIARGGTTSRSMLRLRRSIWRR